MSGIAIITEACIETKDRACVDVCPVQCIYEFDPVKNVLFSEVEAGSGVTENTHTPNPDAIAIFSDSILYVNTDECTSCTACYQPDVCPVGAIYSEERVPDGTPRSSYNPTDTGKGHDHTFFVQLSRDVFAD
jgi:Fe-S-cluster-containing hydrogenase component 2